VRDPRVVKRYWSMWQGLPCEYGLLHGDLCRGEELNHILCGSSKEDAPWNFFIMCAFHHRDNVHGFHGKDSRAMRKEILEAKLAQGFQLPREAYRYLDCGIDGAPDEEIDEDHNWMIVDVRAEAVLGLIS
jgi:hypothetical protein